MSEHTAYCVAQSATTCCCRFSRIQDLESELSQVQGERDEFKVECAHREMTEDALKREVEELHQKGQQKCMEWAADVEAKDAEIVRLQGQAARLTNLAEAALSWHIALDTQSKKEISIAETALRLEVEAYSALSDKKGAI